jgi:hypothetical protein
VLKTQVRRSKFFFSRDEVSREVPEWTSIVRGNPVITSAPAEVPSKTKKRLDAANLIQSILTSIAIVLAGAWFITQSEYSIKANITHSITHRKIDNDWTWIHVSTDMSNVGKVLLEPGCGVATLYSILPLDIHVIDQIKKINASIDSESPIKWPTLKRSPKNLNNQIYPGETDRVDYQFLIPSFIGTVALNTFFYGKPCVPEGEHPPKGWSKFTVYDLNKKGDGDAAEDHNYFPAHFRNIFSSFLGRVQSFNTQ